MAREYDPRLDESTLKALEAIARVCEPPTGPVELDHAYLRRIAIIEAHPACQSGIDKSWVEQSWLRDLASWRNARRIR